MQVTHTEIPGFTGSSFGGGHGADGQVKPGYVGNMIKLLKTYREELEKLFKESP